MPEQGYIVTELKKERGQLARGHPTDTLVDNVRVRCRHCGGVTAFPVLKAGGVRPTPAPCAHCGAEV